MKREDYLCSLQQNGEYFVMSNNPDPRYSNYVRKVATCDRRGISNPSGIKTIKLDWEQRNWARGYSFSTISLKTCSFVFRPLQEGKGWQIIMKNCKDRAGTGGTFVGDKVLGQANYVLE